MERSLIYYIMDKNVSMRRTTQKRINLQNGHDSIPAVRHKHLIMLMFVSQILVIFDSVHGAGSILPSLRMIVLSSAAAGFLAAVFKRVYAVHIQPASTLCNEYPVFNYQNTIKNSSSTVVVVRSLLVVVVSHLPAGIVFVFIAYLRRFLTLSSRWLLGFRVDNDVIYDVRYVYIVGNTTARHSSSLPTKYTPRSG